ADLDAVDRGRAPPVATRRRAVRNETRMARTAWVWPVLVVAGLAGVRGAEPKPPPLPRDTLPAKLSLDTIPRGLDKARPVPEDNPLTEAKVRLGRKLFFDPLLSADRTVACASCHDPAHGFASAEPVAVGVGGKRGRRNAPSLFNRAYARTLFW